ncbi:NAD-dependent succinate-semialdehyde dehydrogenase [Acetobacter peroxydans]|jgi:succinate-semialdehyde dehydrogenase/glutarate-semialdehyde dehydrogenase|uniref:Succinate-semialdehyde dehydrogenase n=1 Tax=Acetobacter peroxydans TaxID=104098 RepID=A0A4Y3TUL9_9PROT|nr:NAD-dependent succinate-semialdehyde dehydrogenase [Acetobacter peroxydans]NHO15638.1 aldehyde dehydrogenase family protein [Acetobacter peroxydans]GBR34666.1 aldehyde dehydrogenase [Acetobacter peroxydans NBRC 13755]GBR42231.1 aldehyde dehydrogenase [Acetobacter peroxydans]GEB84670.1 succinate-semialdehyde dehydrogenase [Acetobacter peroxydans]
MAYATINPFTAEQVKVYPNATDAEIDAALDKAHTAFLSWRQTSFAERAKIMQKAADILRRDSDSYSKLLTLEMGKLFSEAKAETELSAAIFEYYAKNAEALLVPEDLPVASKDEGRAKVIHQPLGILLAVEPWNFPFYQVARIIAPQLSAGNTIVLKHASNVPQSAEAMDRLMIEAGLPEGAFQNLFPSHAQVSRIIADHRVRGVALTGSEGAGAKVAAEAGTALKKCTMELGGADSFIVLEDADLEKAIKWAVFGRHWNAGQVCVSAKRMIVVDAVYDRFLAGYREGVSKLKMGDPMDPATTLAPLSSQGAVDSLRQQVQGAVAAGAKMEEIPLEMPNVGSFFRPVILTDVSPENPARREEFFGPVTLLFRAKDEADAIAIANDSPYGLGGSVFTKDEARGVRVAEQIETGMVYINHPTMVKADLPFGGVLRSGFGRELIGLGIKEFVNHKLIDVVDIDAPF